MEPTSHTSRSADANPDCRWFQATSASASATAHRSGGGIAVGRSTSLPWWETATARTRATQDARCLLFDRDYELTQARIREALGESTFEQSFSEGEALTNDQRSDRVCATWSRGTQAPRQRVGIVNTRRTGRHPIAPRRPIEQGHRRTSVHLPANRPNPPHPHLQQAQPHLTRPGCPGSSQEHRSRRPGPLGNETHNETKPDETT